MIKVNTAALLDAATEISAQADIIQKNIDLIVAHARNKREKQRTLLIFKKTEKDIDDLERDTQLVVEELRNQSLYLKECAKRFRAVQGVAQITIGKMG